jgi:hypothetical protein
MSWHRIDLHIHTPGSKDFEDRDASYLDILKKAEAEGIEIIAFTDHNTVAGYAALMQEISDLQRWDASGRLRAEEKDKLREYQRLQDKLLILPGLEFTATFGFHILGIFDRDMPVRSLEHLLLKLNVPLKSLETGETEVGPTSDVLTAYRVLAEAGALVIAPHANSNSGVAMFGLDFGGQTRIAYTQDSNLHALEVTDLETKKRRTTASFFNGSKPQYPRRMHCIQGSDAHRLHGVPGGHHSTGVGERATEVLLSDVSFVALKELFLGNDFAGTRPYRRSAEVFDFVEAARKEGPSIVQSFHEQATRQGGRLHAIVRDVVALANTNGGTIYVGVSPNRKVPPRGLDKPDEVIDEIRLEVERQVTPPIEISLGTLNSLGKTIVRVTIPKGEDPPYVLEGSKIYLRQEAETSMAMRDEIVALIKRAQMASPRQVAALEDALETAAAKEIAPPPLQAVQKRSEKRHVPRTEVSTRPAPTLQVESSAPQEEEAVPDRGPQLPVPLDRPRTGVEIVASEERQGTTYHTMSDLRDGDLVHNVTRASARRLWSYAIALKEKHTFSPDKVTWVGNYGLWHKYLRAGRNHYDLVQRDEQGNIHIYYGVTEDGIYGPWRVVVGLDE